MSPLNDPLLPLVEALTLFGWLAAPIVLAMLAAAVAEGAARRARIDGDAGRLALRWLAVLAALLLAGPAAFGALADFARWSWGGP